MEGAVVADGKIDAEGLSKSIGKEMVKHTVTKEVYDDVNTKYQTAANVLKNFEDVDLEQLQKELQTEKDGRANDKKEFLFKAALKDAGAVDVEYLVFKHGLEKVELDDSGAIKDLDNITKTLKESYKTQFMEDSAGSDSGSGTGSAGNFGRGKAKEEPESLGQKLGKEQAVANKVEGTDIYFK